MYRVSSSSLLVLLIVQSFFSDSLSLPVSFMNVDEESNALHGSEVNRPGPSLRVECPAGTLNKGWSVEGQSAFTDSLDCCRESRVSDWEVADPSSFQNLETGCSMSKNLLGKPVYMKIYPVFCSFDKDCGDTARNGQRMECCPEGYCLATNPVNGTSRCSTGELPDLGVPGDEKINYYEDPVAEKSQKYKRQGLNTCLSCDKDCKEVIITAIDTGITTRSDQRLSDLDRILVG